MKNSDSNLIISVLAALLILFAFTSVGRMGYGGYGGMMNYGYGMMSGGYGFGGMYIFGWLMMILVIIALVLFIIWLIKQISGERRRK